MAKIKLDSPVLPDVHVIAISSHVNDYRLCWSINRSLGLNLERRRTDIDAQGPQGKALFPAFDSIDEETRTTVTLVGNHAPEGVLLADQHQADYFLVIDEEAPLRPEQALEGLRRTEFILAAFELDIRQLKGAYKLLE